MPDDTLTSYTLLALAATYHDAARADLDAALAAASAALTGLLAAGERYAATVAVLREQLAGAGLKWDLGTAVDADDLIAMAVSSIDWPDGGGRARR